MFMRPVCVAMMIVLLGCLAGCQIPAQVFWSPDGSKAAYIPTGAGEAMVISETGDILGSIGATAGGMAWSPDSKRLYYALAHESKPERKAFAVGDRWLNLTTEEQNELITAEEEAERKARDAAVAAGEEPKKKDQEATIGVWEDGKPSTLFWLKDVLVSYMVISRDGKWLALATTQSGYGPLEGLSAIYVYNIPDKKLDMLSAGCERAIAFTGPSRLAFIETYSLKHGVKSEVSRIVEVDLTEAAAPLTRNERAIVIAQVTTWMTAAGDDLLFATIPVTFPLPKKALEDDLRRVLYRLVRGTDDIKPVIEGVGEIFIASPDGKRVIVEKLGQPKQGAEAPSKLAIVDLATGALHEVADWNTRVTAPSGTAYEGVAAFPVWRNNNEISWVRPADQGKRVTEAADLGRVDLGLYRLTDKYQFELIRLLSTKWPDVSRPSVKKSNVQTAPAK